MTKEIKMFNMNIEETKLKCLEIAVRCRPEPEDDFDIENKRLTPKEAIEVATTLFDWVYFVDKHFLDRIEKVSKDKELEIQYQRLQ